MRILELDGLDARFAVAKLTVIGAAMRIHCLGGSILSRDEMMRAVASPYLFTQHEPEIMRLLETLEAQTQEAA